MQGEVEVDGSDNDIPNPLVHAADEDEIVATESSLPVCAIWSLVMLFAPSANDSCLSASVV